MQIFLFFILVTECSIGTLFAADNSVQLGSNIPCPIGAYTGTLELMLNGRKKQDLFENMVFVYGDKAENISNHGTVNLKAVMLCRQGENSVDIATKYIGTCVLSQQGTCDMALNGQGFINNNSLVEKGTVNLHCKNSVTYRGTYTIKAEN